MQDYTHSFALIFPTGDITARRAVTGGNPVVDRRLEVIREDEMLKNMNDAIRRAMHPRQRELA
jgi:hypothetical protein